MNGRIRQLRKILDLSLEKFGEKLGVTSMAISNIERGNRSVTRQMEKAICREYNVNPIWLNTGEGEMFLSSPADQVEEYLINQSDETMAKIFTYAVRVLSMDSIKELTMCLNKVINMNENEQEE